MAVGGGEVFEGRGLDAASHFLLASLLACLVLEFVYGIMACLSNVSMRFVFG